jgi:hypothetical protein
MQSQNLPRLVRRRDVVAQHLDDLARLLDQRRVARRHLALLQIDVVLEPHARMAAEQYGLRHHGELMQRNAEGEPRRVRRQQVSHIGHGLGRRRLAPGYAEADLKHPGRLDEAVLDEALGEQQMAGLEHFQLGRHAGGRDRGRHRLQVLWRVDEDAVAHVEAAHVETANVGLELDHVAHPVFRRPEHAVGAGFCRIVVVVRKPRAGPGGEVDQHVGAPCPDALDHLAIKRIVHARLGGLRIAHVDVHDGSTCLGGIDRRTGDLLRRHRHGRVAAGRVGRAGHGAGDDDFALHDGRIIARGNGGGQRTDDGRQRTDRSVEACA